MGKSNIMETIESAFNDSKLWAYLYEIISYYVHLRNIKQDDLFSKLGYSSKASMALIRRGHFTPRQIEILISVLKIEDEDANRIRSRYWTSFCGEDFRMCQFNRLYAPNTESVIRELLFEKDQLRKEIETLKSSVNTCEMLIEYYKEKIQKNEEIATIAYLPYPSESRISVKLDGDLSYAEKVQKDELVPKDKKHAIKMVGLKTEEVTKEEKEQEQAEKQIPKDARDKIAKICSENNLNIKGQFEKTKLPRRSTK